MRCHFRRLCVSLLGGGILLVLVTGWLVLFDNHRLIRSYSRQSPSWSIDLPLLLQASLSPTNSTILVCVPSAPGSLDKRQAIRETWGTTRSLRVIFFIGVPQGPNAAEQQKFIEAENESFGDVVQAKFDDNYRNLTLKMIVIILWAVENHWPTRRLIIKADDDTFINTPLLLGYLDHFTNGNIYGLYQKSYKVPRCNQSACMKWGLTDDEFPKDVFPPHVRGAMYIFTEFALDRISRHLFDPPFLYIEDVYITGLVANRAGVPVCNIPEGLKVIADNPTRRTLSRLGKGLLSQHYCKPDQQRLYWKHVRANLPYKHYGYL